MKKSLVLVVFVLAALGLAVAQQPGAVPDSRSTGQATSPGAQAPTTVQPSGSVGQTPSQAAPPSATPGAMASAPITEGCLAGNNPNFTITDKAGKTYKLNIPANADATPLNSHIGESVQVLGPVNSGNPATIDVNKVGRGNGNCGAGNVSAPQK